MGCSDTENNSAPEEPSIEMEGEVDVRPVIGSDGGTFTVTFTASGDWTASVNAVTRTLDWLSVSPTQGGAGTVTLQISAQPNESYDERNAAVLLTCGNAQQTITVTQKQKDALLVNSHKVEMDAEGGTFDIELQANVNVTYEIEEAAKDWLTASSSSSTRGLTTSTLSFQVAENPDVSVRQAVITLRGNDLREEVTVYQAGSEPAILLSQKEYTVPSDGETIQVELKSNTSYKVVMPDVPWITEASTRTFSAYTHYFTVAANESYDARAAEIYFVDEENGFQEKVIVTQVQKDALLVSSNRVEMDAIGGTFSLELQSNVSVSYEIEESAKDWLTASSSSTTRGLTSSTLSFQVAENPDESARQAVITLRGNDLTEQVTVYQAGSVPAILLSQKEYTVPSDGETIQVELKSNTSYKVVMPDVPWITEASTRSFSAYTHYFTVAANEGYDARTAEIYFVNEENGLQEKVIVNQVQKDAIVVAEDEYTMDAEGGRLEFTVGANVDFKVDIDTDWIRQIVATRGLVEHALIFEVDGNNADESRKAIITLTADGCNQVITVVQRGKFQTDGNIDDIPIQPW